MITADTITDEQIRELRESLVKGDTHTELLCNQALGIAMTLGTLKPGANAVVNKRTARARCAELLNARAAQISADDRAPCRHCRQPKGKHGAADNPVRPFACPGAKEPKWPHSIKDMQRAGELYDRRLAKFWSERSTSFQEVR